MLWKRTRDIIIETAAIVNGLKDDFKSHTDDNREDIDGLYKVIKECHESCPESARFDEYIKGANGTLLRIEKKFIAAELEAKEVKKGFEKRQDDYLAKLDTIKDEVKGTAQAKKTFRQVMGDIGKVTGYLILFGGLVFGIMRYCEVANERKNSLGDVKIEKLLKQLLEEKKVEAGVGTEEGH